MSGSRFRPDIEGLRGLAILLVVAYHYGVPLFGGGYVGVDVFFVLSGYLITGLVLDEIEKTGSLNFVQFYSRRARRLLPAVSACLLAVMIAGYFVYVPFEQIPLSGSSVAAAAYVSNLHFARSATDYLAGANDTNPFLHMWSLSVEEQFYFAWPLFLYLANLATRSKGRAPGDSRLRLLIVMAASAVLSFLLCVALTGPRQAWAFFSSPTRAWEFGIGAIGIVLAPSRNAVRARLFAWFGMAGVAGSAILFGKETVFPGTLALIPSLGTVLVLRGYVQDSGGLLQSWVSARWLQRIGSISYSLYLWHWPVFVLATAALGALSPLQRFAALTCAIVLSILSFRYVERPIRASAALGRYPRAVLVGALALTFCVVGAGFAWRVAASRAAAGPLQARYTAAHDDRPLLPYRNGCVLDLMGSEIPDCSFGTKDPAAPTVVLFGDSHALHWFPAVYEMAIAEGWRVVPVTKSACPPADISFVHFQLKRRYVECEEWRGKALDLIDRLRPQFVVVSNLTGYLNNREEWREGLKRTYDRIAKAGARIVYLRDTPRPATDVPRCLSRASWYGRTSSDCAFERPLDIETDESHADMELLKTYPGAIAVDLIDKICPVGKTCPAEAQGQVIYSDSDHLAAGFAVTLAPDFRSAVNSALKLKSR